MSLTPFHDRRARSDRPGAATLEGGRRPFRATGGTSAGLSTGSCGPTLGSPTVGFFWPWEGCRVQLALTVLPGCAQEPVDVRVELDPDRTVAELRAALAHALPGDHGDRTTLWAHDVPLVLDATVGSSGLLDGDVVGLGAPGPERPDGTGLGLHVTGGPDAGLVMRLTPGGLVVGRDGGQLTDPDVSRRHARLRVAREGITVEDLQSTNGTQLDGLPVTTATPLPPGAVLSLGETRAALVRTGPTDVALSPDGQCGLDHNRRPRLLAPTQQSGVLFPEPPPDHESRGFPALALAAPLAVGLAMAAVLGPRMLLFALLSPVMLVSNWAGDRRHGRRAQNRRSQEYEAAHLAAEAELTLIATRQAQARRQAHPDPAALLLIARGPRRRLWERRPADPDALAVRVGLGRLLADVTLTTPRDVHIAAPWLADVPVTLPLAELGVLGVAGAPAVVRAVGRWLVCQLAVLHPPRDLTVVVLTHSAAGSDWSWLAWLPHARPGPGGRGCRTLIGNDTTTTAERVAELSRLVAGRAASAAEASTTTRFPSVLVVLDGARRLRQLPGVPALLRDGPDLGVQLICLDAEERLLPEECRATLAMSASATRAAVRRTRHGDVDDVLVDQVTPTWAEEVARALAPLRDAGDGTEAAALPGSCRLLDLLDMPEPDPARLAAGWAQPSMRVLLGAGTDGPFAVDLVADGPHGLVAGTTGSGKSELLQTVVASLAVASPPTALTFVLIDYKGGSAFKDCARLPHTVGMVTDLDAHLVARALASLGAELTRRERILHAAGAKDLVDLLQGGGQLPRLLIVIDEFATLARELPDFVAGLVSLSQRGRSLGMHLLLATQRPGGAVSPEIRANTDLRIALRVTDSGESSDVLDVGDAARIPRTTPGRAFARLGQGTLVPFQAARVGGRRPGADRHRPIIVTPTSWAQLGYPHPVRAEACPDEEETDLSVLVDALRAAADRTGTAAPQPPWLPPLPTILQLTDLAPDGLVPSRGGRLRAAPYALLDRPKAQEQRPVGLDLDADGHLFAVGAPGSGRSQLLRTLAASLAQQHGTADVHLFGLDCGGGALQALEALPHTGAVVSRAEPERVARLLARLGAEVTRRQALLASAGCATLTELRSTGTLVPHLVLLLDRWEGFTTSLGETDSGALTEQVLALLREGVSAGLHVVVTGDRSLLLGRMSTTTDHKVVLRVADRGDYTLAGLDPRALPSDVPPGRAFLASSGDALQIALLAPEPTGTGQAEALVELGIRCTLRDAGVALDQRPIRIDRLPTVVDLHVALAVRPAGPLYALLGLGGDDSSAVGVDLATASPALLVGGPARSGRSSTLLALAASFLSGGAEVVVIAPRASPLRSMAGRTGVRCVLTDPNLTDAALAAALEAPGPVAVLVDDAPLLRDSPARDRLRGLVTGSVADQVGVVAGSTEELAAGFTGWLVEARRSRHGLLLSPQTLADGDAVGARLPRSALGGPRLPGRGLAHLGDGRWVPVQVPRPP